MKILFCTSNLGRKSEFQIQTLIYKQNNKIFVRKTAANEKAIPHINQSYYNNDLIKNNSSKVKLVNYTDKKDNYNEYEYVDLPTLELLIENAIAGREFGKTVQYINVFNSILDKFQTKEFNPYDNNNFVEIFDKDKKFFKDSPELCCNIAILDLNYDNLLHGDETFLIDQEWIFNFPIPKRYIAFRCLYYLSAKLQSLIGTFCSKDFPCYEVIKGFYIPKIWFDIYDFTTEEVERFFNYEVEFQNSVSILKNTVEKDQILNEKTLKEERQQPNIETVITDLNIKSEQKDQYIADLQRQIEAMNLESNSLRDEVKSIKESKSYKVAKKLSNIKSKLSF